MRTHRYAGFLLLLLTIARIHCAPPPPEAPPNIVWIIAEDLSPALGAYGDTLAHTPRLDALAERGIVYEKAFATAPICAPARSTLVTGVYATSMGTQHLRSETPFSTQLETLPEYLTGHGYFTTNQNKTDYNFDPTGLWDRRSGEIAAWRHREGNQPFFSVINIGTTHEGQANRGERYEERTRVLNDEERMDPDVIQVPPYYPDTPEAREVWARYYDLIRVMDRDVGEVLDSLEADGLMEDTVVMYFGDHGFGMPRYKRWLYDTGLRVPLIVYIPEKYQHLNPGNAGSVNQELVSFVDFAPTTLRLAGVEIPASMEGQPFLGPDRAPSREYVYGARDRADDMFEMSRAVTDGRYIFVRNYMPHLPYIQPGFINSDGKLAYKALRDSYREGTADDEQMKLWNPKPVFELYDLQDDPEELTNLAGQPEHAGVQRTMHDTLQAWMVEIRDLGLLPEAEYMIRSEGSTPYDYARSSDTYRVREILDAAERVGTEDTEAIRAGLQHPDSGVRYWSVIALQNSETATLQDRQAAEALLTDSSASVRIAAAEMLGRRGESEAAIETLGELVRDDRPWVALQAARSIQLIGEHARPLIPVIYDVLDKNLNDGTGSHRKYMDFNYAAFTSWALEWALQEMGEDITVN